MKVVEWTDENGYKRRRQLRNKDPNSMRESGVPLEPPDLDQLDWATIKRDLHNALFDRGLVTWQDVQRSQNGVTTAILATVRRKLIVLYKVRRGG